MRQTQVKETGKRKVCSQCGAGLWLKNENTGEFSGPWHFSDCITVPGGEVLQASNLEDKYMWDRERWVPKEQARRILGAILAMMDSPGIEVMVQRKVAIQEEIAKL